MKLTLTQIANKTGGTLVGQDMMVTAVVTDSRLVKDGSLFALINGQKTDGMNYVNEVEGKFAAAYLTDRPVKNAKNPYILVKDVIKAVGDIANLHISTVGAKHIAVTGSVGKTTTKNYIAAALSECINVSYSSGNKNNELGMPLCALETTNEHSALIVEMGMRGLGQITYLCDIVKPDIAVITNIGVSHIELLGSKQNILKAKTEIVDALSQDGVAILNADDELLSTYKTDKKVIYYGIESEKAHVRAINVLGNKFELVYNSKSYPVTLSALGKHNIYNALAAVAVGVCLGLDIEELIIGVQNFVGDGRRQNIYQKNGYTIFDDTYNASPASIEAAINVIKDFEGRKVLVLADMLELGDHSKALHESLAPAVLQSKAELVICIGGNMSFLAQKIRDKVETYALENNEQALEILKQKAKPGDNILFKGSNSMNLAKLKGDFENGI